MTSAIDLSELNRLQAVVEESRNLMREAARKMVKDGTKAIFEEYGDIVTQFGWIQYTPYFNDGDECVFGMHELSVIATADRDKIAAELDEYALDDYMSDWAYEGSPSFSPWGDDAKIAKRWGDKGEGPHFDQRYEDAYRTIRSVYEIFSTNAQLAKDIFGDHIRVIFTKDGVEAESYDHD